MAIHTATGEASRVYSISVNTMSDGCFLRGRGASCFLNMPDLTRRSRDISQCIAPGKICLQIDEEATRIYLEIYLDVTLPSYLD